MNRFTMSIIARSMEINIRRIKPTIIRRVAQAPQEEGSDLDVRIRWVSKNKIIWFHLFIKIRNLVFSKLSFWLILVEVKNSLLYFFGCSLVQKFSSSCCFYHEDKKTQNSKMLKRQTWKAFKWKNMVAIETQHKQLILN